MEDSAKRRVVAIVGRPNVGKSAIFNRMAGKRIAIVHSESGVTRDRLMREVIWGDEHFELIDTGGICGLESDSRRDVIEMGIHSQADAALEDAAVAVMVVDVQAGIMPMDESVASILRESGVPAVIAVNKADLPEHDSGIFEFSRLGLPLFAVSALHNRGFDDLMVPVIEALPETANITIEKPLRVAVVGRPNVGKSSYINRLLRSDRVIVSDIPGTTRDSIDVPFMVGSGDQARHYLLIDTAGMRRVGKIDSSVERFSHFRSEKSIRDADVVVHVLDATVGPTAQDKHIASVVQDAAKGCLLLVNKWDLTETTQRQYGPKVASVMPFVAYCPIVFASAESGYNIRRTVEAIDYVASQVQTVLPTGVLNRTLKDAFERVQPPSFKGRSLKIYYAAQVGTMPVRVRVFVNEPRCVQMNYRQYLIKQLRARFGLEGAPLQLQFRSRHQDRHEAPEATKESVSHKKGRPRKGGMRRGR